MKAASHVSAPPTNDRLPRMQRGVAVVCLVLGLWHVWQLPGAWQEWHAGMPDFYPGQHRGLLLGHVTGLALALAIPLPGVMTSTRARTRASRAALSAAWIVLMGVIWAALALQLLR